MSCLVFMQPSGVKGYVMSPMQTGGAGIRSTDVMSQGTWSVAYVPVGSCALPLFSI